MSHCLLNGVGDEQFFLHPLLGGAGQLSDGDEHGHFSLCSFGQALFGGPHHVDGAGGVHIGHVDSQLGQVAHGLVHGVGDIVELQIQEHIVAHGFQLADNVRPFAIEQLHADFHKGLFLLELAEEIKSILSGGEIAGDDHIMFFHF